MSARRHHIRRLVVLFSLAALFAGTSVVPASAGGTIQSGFQMLKNGASAKCMDNPGSSQSWGVQMVQWTCGNPLPANQTWNLFYPNTGFGTWMIQNKASGLCLDVWQANYQNGTKIVQWPCDGSDVAEQFIPQYGGTPCRYNPSGSFYTFRVWAKTSMVIEINGQTGADGTKLDIWQYWGAVHQSWYNC